MRKKVRVICTERHVQTVRFCLVLITNERSSVRINAGKGIMIKITVPSESVGIAIETIGRTQRKNIAQRNVELSKGQK